MSDPSLKAIIVGAGPAGLTAAYELSKPGQRVLVLEADPQYVGGISRTVSYHGYRFDIGGHRFFSKSREVEDLWTEILGADMLKRPRSSKIYYRGQFYDHSMMTAMLAARNILASENKYDLWAVNEDGEYHESGRPGLQKTSIQDHLVMTAAS